HGADARCEFPQVDGFAQIIVCTQFETNDPVYRFTCGGKHDDGQRTAIPKCAQDTQSVFSGHVNVQQDQRH
ncbi:MAG: hypothetical protein Q8L84_06070, partial [Hyphomonas sp.]|nr:hypothetical protein [Hyphomonas sp.]